jgi:DNA-directed RNA polymerase specialized sigma24 family protein
MGCPVNTVKTRLFHARAKLQKLLPALGGISSKDDSDREGSEGK